MSSHDVQIEFLTREGCVNTPLMRDHLERALARIHSSPQFDVIDQGSLKSSDPRTGYPTPTILVNGRDLFGLPHPIPPYPQPG